MSMFLSPALSSSFPSIQRHLSRLAYTRSSAFSSSHGTLACGRRASSRCNHHRHETNRLAKARGRALSSEGSSGGKASSFLDRCLGPKPMPPRNTLRWYGEMALICTVFGITGSSTMVVVRPAVSDVLGLQGTFKDGPWSYRICSVVIMTPIYATLLVIVGTVFGRHAYFRHFSVKMFSRFGIPPELMDKNFHSTAKHFKKW